MGSKTSTSFGKGQNNKRGKAERTKILEALKRKGITEEGFYDLLVERAIDPEDNFALKEVLSRFSPLKKAVLPDIEFDFNKAGTPVEQVGQILSAISEAKIPPDVGISIISAIKAAIDIEESTELKTRIAEIEKLIGL